MKMPPKNKRNNSGFSFLEVLAALLIIIILIMPLYFQSYQSANAQLINQDLYEANLIAKNKIELLRNHYENNGRLISRDIMDTFVHGIEESFNWFIEWELISQGTNTGLYLITVTCFKEEENHTNITTSLTTMLIGELK